MYLLYPFILQNLQKTLRADPELWGCAIFGPKMADLPWTIFFGTNHYYYFPLSIRAFYYAKFKKILTTDQELWECAIFDPKWCICPKQTFFWKIIIITLIYLLAPFIVQNFKKIVPADPELWGCATFGPKIAHFPKWQFFLRKTVNEPCFFHSFLSICPKSKSDINLLVKYWRLKKTEISLAESHFWL